MIKNETETKETFETLNNINFELDTKMSSLKCTLEDLGKIELVRINGATDENYKIWKFLIEKYHYIGHGKLYGLQIRYLIRSEHLGWIGAMSFSSPAWRLDARDNWIGWNEENRLKHLNEIVCQSRFLIIPQLKVKNFASYVLSMSIKQIKNDWTEKYGIAPLLLETFVEKDRYKGTCYQASNFQYAGETQGRGRQDSNHEKALPIKDVYLYPLKTNYREQLCAGQTFEEIKEPQPADWVEEEFINVDFGDERLKSRLYEITRDFYGSPVSNIPQACQSRAKTKAVYRFLDNQKITMEKILNSHYESTIKRIGKEKVVLAAQDTSTLNYSTHPATENLGPIGSQEDGIIGLMVHDTMAFNLEGTPLGLIDVQCWQRDIEEYGEKEKRKKLPIEKKESNKWLISFKAAAVAQAKTPNTMIVSMGDREADIYELFELALEDSKGPKLLIRAVQDRIIIVDKQNQDMKNKPVSEIQDRIVDDEQSHLWDYMKNKPVSGIQQIKVPRKGTQRAREADLTIRFSEVELKAPASKKEKKNIKIWAILASEENAPETVESLCWLLLTTIPIKTFEEAIEKLKWYTKRWGIEIYHKTLKSGCKIEQRQLGNADRIEACLGIDMVIAWRIYHLTKLGREVPNVPCTVFFEDAEWKTLIAYITKNPIAPKTPPSLREAMRMVASLGGFLGRKSDGEPGTKTLWLGLQELDIATEMWKIFNKIVTPDSLAPP